ncbi:SWPV1-039 [Shearwaterpox virus]|uniref:SWPV1-039 n=1 Tax=Shearwaterpox virus TaxID=1974596 RepID=A0A1V0S7P6_CNPV|nr:SWPV1-039 [Shearwaterpox virus]
MSYKIQTGEIKEDLLKRLSNGIYLTLEQQKELKYYGDVCIKNTASLAEYFDKRIKYLTISSENSENMIYIKENQEFHIYCLWCVKRKTTKINVGNGRYSSGIEDNIISIREGNYLVINPLCDSLCVYTGVKDNITLGLSRSVIIVFDQ